MTTISPSPFPESGRRTLSARETMQRARAVACTLPKDNTPTCSGQVFVGLFFDGTGIIGRRTTKNRRSWMQQKPWLNGSLAAALGDYLETMEATP